MRVNAKAATLVAIMTLGSLVGNACVATTATAQDSTGHKVAVIDVAYIFKNHPLIKQQVEKVESDLKSYESTLKTKRDELKNSAERLKTLNPGTNDYSAQEEKVAGLESKLRLEMARKRKELADAEAQIYYQNYQRIAECVRQVAAANKIDLVIRYNSENMDLSKGESVIRGVMKNIVYHDQKLDMTPAVMQYLEKVKVPEQVASRNAGRNR